ncbi:MAG: PASTA domain-containing protein [Actinomycetia bacterium]|nr:PASTA domain-containing protein [Actinomycetes bacterium]
MHTDLTLLELLQLPPVERDRPYPEVGLSLRMKLFIAAVSLCALALLAYYGVQLYLDRPTVPEVIGMTEQQARSAARAQGLDLAISATLYSTEAAGTVIGQTPDAGAKPLLSRSMRVVLSSGKQAITVPDLIGETELRARSIIEQFGLNAQVVYEYAPDQIGKVVSTQPEALAVVNTGDIVVLRIGAPRSQVALVEYDLHGDTIVISAPTNGSTDRLASDIAIRLSSLLQAAQANVVLSHEPTGYESAFIELTTGEQEVAVVEVKGEGETVEQLGEDSLSAAVFTRLSEIPLAVSYGLFPDAEFVRPQRSVVISFGTEGDTSLYQDTRWKDNVARSIYLALGQTLVR